MGLGRLGKRFAVLPFALTLASGGCGSDDKQTPGQEFWGKYADIYCPGAKPCCEARGAEHDVGACREFYTLLGGYGSSGKKYDAAAADQCLAELQTAIDQCVAAGFSDPKSCSRVFSGSKQPGESCQLSTDCAVPAEGTVTCYHDSSAGTCKATPPAAEGQPCGLDGDTATEHYECETDRSFYCDATAKICKKRLAVGQACSGSNQCVDDADCSNGTCTANVPIDGDCSSMSCVSTAYCDGSSQKCIAKKQLGEACTTSSECQDFCTNGQCSGSGGGTLCVTN